MVMLMRAASEYLVICLKILRVLTIVAAATSGISTILSDPIP